MSQPNELPRRTSEGKCCCPATLLRLTALASPYTATFVSHPGYRSATTGATAQTIAECTDGNDELGPDPFRNRPDPSPSSGRSRLAISFTTSVAMTLAATARALTVAVVVAYSSECRHPYHARYAGIDNITPEPAFANSELRSWVSGPPWKRSLIFRSSVANKNDVAPAIGISHARSFLRRCAGLVMILF
jgi:hypothetical protein